MLSPDSQWQIAIARQIATQYNPPTLPIVLQWVEDSFSIITTQGYDINNARTHFKTDRKANTETNKEINNA